MFYAATSYNSINGVPSCANEQMLGKILRGKWGFQGMVTSDSGAVADISSGRSNSVASSLLIDL